MPYTINESDVSGVCSGRHPYCVCRRHTDTRQTVRVQDGRVILEDARFGSYISARLMRYIRVNRGMSMP